VDIWEIDQEDEALVRRHWEIARDAEAHRPYDFSPPWEQAWVSLSQVRDDVDIVLLGAFEDEVMQGAVRLNLSLHDNTHMASVDYHTHPDRQRRGIGRAMAERSYDVARARGRTLMVTEAFAPVDGTSPGLLFAEAMGFTTAIVDGMKVVDLVETEPLWDDLLARTTPRHGDYRILTWLDRVPDELVASYCRLNETFFSEAPMGDLDIKPEVWDEDRVRQREERNLKQRRHDVSAGAVAKDGTMVGVTEVSVSDASPGRGMQSGTIVAREHRGHALGLAIKLANHRQLREHFPECRLLLTGNADVNAPMNAVNEALGYREVERCLEMQRPI
jgi:GNAT superfamily N-acetyltransferase